jgi:acetate kinase
MVCEGLNVLGVKYDDAKNETIGTDGGTFHQKGSTVALLVVPTDEELEIALQCEGVLGSI